MTASSSLVGLAKNLVMILRRGNRARWIYWQGQATLNGMSIYSCPETLIIDSQLLFLFFTQMITICLA